LDLIEERGAKDFEIWRGMDSAGIEVCEMNVRLSFPLFPVSFFNLAYEQVV
jgi:hypothetical protein